MIKNCSSDREKLSKFEDEDWEFADFLRSLEQFIQTVKGHNNWKILLGFRNLQEKLENVNFFTTSEESVEDKSWSGLFFYKLSKPFLLFNLGYFEYFS